MPVSAGLQSLRTGMLVLLAALPLGRAHAAGEHPEAFELPPFSAYYSGYAGSLRVAKARLTLSVQGDHHVYASFTRPAGMLALLRNDTISERSEWIYRDGKIRSLDYRYLRHGRKSKDIHLVFRWPKHEVSNIINGQTWRMKIPPGTLDKFSVQLALMLDLARGARSLRYDIADGGKLKNFHFRILGKEAIHVPAGTYQTVKLIRERADQERKTYLWCAPKLDYLVVRVEHVETDGSRYHMSLDKVEGIR